MTTSYYRVTADHGTWQEIEYLTPHEQRVHEAKLRITAEEQARKELAQERGNGDG